MINIKFIEMIPFYTMKVSFLFFTLILVSSELLPFLQTNIV